jgi:putative transposase
MFPWAKFRQAKGAIKIHARLDHSGQIPDFVRVTTGKTHEIKVARTLALEADDILVFDRAMTDYKWLNRIDEQEAYFVTRAKHNRRDRVLRNPEHELPHLTDRARQRGVLKDQVIGIVGSKADDIPIELRLVVYQDPETGKIYRFLTNIFHLAALTIAQIYQARWEIETFFKWIKQHLKIKTFLGTSENAVMTQIWIVMITYLLLAYLKYQTRSQYSLLHIQRLLRENIFVRMSLNALLIIDWREPDRQQAPLNSTQLVLQF